MNTVVLSQFISRVLRHQPELIGLTLDANGWADVNSLLTGAQAHGQPLTRELIDHIVQTSSKKRFQFDETNTRIRAVQGHSTTQVALEREARVPPSVLFHGTADRFWDSIAAQGLLPGKRHQVHLSPDVATAIEVGRRHGRVIVLEVDAAALHAQGHRFEQAENGVWLTGPVPAWALRHQ